MYIAIQSTNALDFTLYKIKSKDKIRLLLFQGAEFDVYKKFADDILKPNGRERLNTLLQRSDCIVSCQVSYSSPSVQPLSRPVSRVQLIIVLEQH